MHTYSTSNKQKYDLSYMQDTLNQPHRKQPHRKKCHMSR